MILFYFAGKGQTKAWRPVPIETRQFDFRRDSEEANYLPLREDFPGELRRR